MRVSWTPALILLLTLGATAALASDPVTPDEVTGPDTWGGLEGVAHLRHLSFGGQPDPAALRAAKERGVVAVVNLRHPSEQDGLGWDEGSQAEALGLAYHQIPVTPPDLYEEATVAAIEAAIAEHGEGHVLVHCASGNRVGGWLALHLARRHDMSIDDSLAVGRRAGLTKPAVEDAVRSAHAKRGSAQP